MLDDWKNVGEWTVVDRPEYECELQEYRRGNDQMVFIHLNVHKWSKDTLKIAKADFKLLRKCVTCPLYACGESDDDKWAHFVSLFGFKQLSTAHCTDGKQRRVFIHILDGDNNVFKQTTNTVVPVEYSEPVGSSVPVSKPSV